MPIGKSNCLGPPCEIGAEPASGVGVTEEAGSSLGVPSLANQSARLLQIQGGGTAVYVEGLLPVVEDSRLVAGSPDELD